MSTLGQPTSDKKISTRRTKNIVVQLKADKIVPYGGIYPVILEFEKLSH